MPFILHFAGDLKFAVRSLLRAPAFTIAAALVLALGIGATSTVFSLVDAVLLQPLPYDQPSRRVMIWSRWKDFDKTWVSSAEVADYRTRCKTLSNVAAWDGGLVDAGARVMAFRAEWAATASPGFERRYAVISEGEPARLAYAPSVPLSEEVPSVAAATEAFRGALARSLTRERERGVTLVGPHRDDIALLVQRGGEERELRDYGSGGQQRTAAIALRMVEAESIREARGREPVVLLDDVFAELDAGRSRRILELLEAEERGQTILTAPKQSDFEPHRGSLPHWRIENGQVLQ